MADSTQNPRFRFWLWLIRLIGVIVPHRLRADWKQEWAAELRSRELLLCDWDLLNWRTRLDLLRRSLGSFWDALALQPQRLEEQMFQDIRYAIRMLVKNIGFTSVVVLTLGLGIGANAALFSVVNGVLLNPLPYPEPDQLITLHQSKPNFQTGAIPYPNFRDWREKNQTFSAMTISRGASFSLIGTGEPERVKGRWVTAEFFSVLGVKPAVGRDFLPGEDEPGAGPVALISAELWQRKFGQSPDVVGKGLTLDDNSYTIVGVLPSSFGLLRGTDVYVLFGQWKTPALRSRSAGLSLHGIGRLKPGVTLAQAQADLDMVMSDLAAAYPQANRGNGATLIPLKESLIGDVGTTLWLLLGAVGFVLLIACVNVSNLLLARSTGRSREFAIRAALGAGQWRLVRQLLTESMLLALIGGGLGLLVAYWGTGAALKVLPTALPRAQEISIDGRVLLFTLTISTLTGMLAGLAPALKTIGWQLSEVLKEGGQRAGSVRHRMQGILVALEMALAVVLLIGAGLMIRSLSALWKVDPGFRTDNLLTFGLAFPPSMEAATPEAANANVRELSDQLNSMTGVHAASFSAGASPLQSEDDLFFWIEGQPKPASTSVMEMALVYRVEPPYLAAMGIPLKQGRFFDQHDDDRSQPVAVIDEVFARKHFANEDPIGKRLYLGDKDPYQIVGVVGHVMQWSLDANDRESLQAQVYQSIRQVGAPSTVGVLVRADGNSTALLDSIQRVVRAQNSENVIYGSQSMTEVIAESLATHRFSMSLLGVFAVASLLLASIGIYGVISYLVGQRTHELGIRIALGATSRDIMRMVITDGMRMATGGVAIGLVGAFGLTRLISQMLFGVRPTDPMTFGTIAVLLLVVALLACYLPARRAMKVDPLTALRQE